MLPRPRRGHPLIKSTSLQWEPRYDYNALLYHCFGVEWRRFHTRYTVASTGGISRMQSEIPRWLKIDAMVIYSSDRYRFVEYLIARGTTWISRRISAMSECRRRPSSRGAKEAHLRALVAFLSRGMRGRHALTLITFPQVIGCWV